MRGSNLRSVHRRSRRCCDRPLWFRAVLQHTAIGGRTSCPATNVYRRAQVHAYTIELALTL
eukprot:14044196-Alexandrium_andersonii.AAC.1